MKQFSWEAEHKKMETHVGNRTLFMVHGDECAHMKQWRSQGRVPGVPEPPLRDIAIAKSREKILLEPPFNSARLEK